MSATLPRLDAYLLFDGTCEQAVRFYERVLKANLMRIMKYSDAPVGNTPSDGCSPHGTPDRIMHAALELNGRVLMASDTMPGQPAGMNGFSLALSYDSVADAERVFKAFAEGGKITMPWAPTFWVEMFGSVTDKFGTPWMINGGKPKV